MTYSEKLMNSVGGLPARFRCHHCGPDVDGRAFPTVREAAEFGGRHYRERGHVGVVHAGATLAEIDANSVVGNPRWISLIDLGFVAGLDMSGNGIRQ